MVLLILKNKLFFLLCLITLYSCGRGSEGRRPISRRTQKTEISRPPHIVDNRAVNSKRTSIVDDVKSAPTTSVGFLATEIFEKFNSAVFMVFTTTESSENIQGSGFFISNDGLAVSNYHVFEGATKGTEVIKLTSGEEYQVSKIIDYDKELDYILFRVDLGHKRVNFIPITNRKPKIGEKVYAIGSPLGLENTFSSGEISQIRESYVLQISVPIDHGSSGGALINERGEVIGITTFGIMKSSANLNFAMSIEVISRDLSKYIVEKLDLRPSCRGELVDHCYLSLSYIEKHEQAEWVYYQLTSEILNGKYRRTNDFRKDFKVSTGSATLADYKGSGYNRGHLCPAGSMTGNSVAMSESFLLSNMSPQTTSLNSGQWRMLEEAVRDWVDDSKMLCVVTGPVFKDNIGTIGVNKITVPGYFYKVVFDPSNNKMIGFVLPNARKVPKRYYEYVRSVNDIEEITGIDFFCKLDDEIEECLESVADLRKWGSEYNFK